MPAACTHKKFATEEIAKRCLWAMGLNGRDNSKLTVVRCPLCKKWRIRRA